MTSISPSLISLIMSPRRDCPDGGRCHHQCWGRPDVMECWRKETGCAPLSASGLLLDWTEPDPVDRRVQIGPTDV